MPAAGRRLHLHAFALNLQRVDADERTVIDPVDPGLLASLTRGEAGERGRRDDADDSR